ncbi:hypothetical protein N7453_002688, partial [Penicillium expansum]
MSPHYQGTFNGGRDHNSSCVAQLRIGIGSDFGTCPCYRGILQRGSRRVSSPNAACHYSVHRTFL